MIENHYSSLIKAIALTTATLGRSRVLDIHEGIKVSGELIKSHADKGGKIFFIGNGGSAAIASHMAVDFWKNGGIKAIAFNDASLLTCISNDFGYGYVFQKPIEMFVKKPDMLIAISSSGKSKNIINAVKTSIKKGCQVITLSGFKRNNPLSKLGQINFYVPVSEYSDVEIMHHSICHYILDGIMQRKGRRC